MVPFLTVLVGLWSAGPAPGPSLEVVADTVRPRHATLGGWDRRVRRAVWDRGGSYGGLYHDRGVLRHWTPEMDHEYDIDLVSIRPSLADDAAFYASGVGFRTSAGSVTTVRFAIETELRAATPLVGPLGLEASVVQQEDPQADRSFVELAYLVDVGAGHRLGVRHSFASRKMDLDAEVVYRYGGRGLDAEVSAGRLEIGRAHV